MKLIGLAGPAKSGKDEIAKHLREHYSFEQHSMAQPMREMIMAGLKVTIDWFHGEKKERAIPWVGASTRKLMQTLGTEWGRELIGENIWLDIARHRWEMCQQLGKADGLVISDVRFDNEADWVREEGGDIWHVERDVEKVREHASEAGVERHPEDFIIPNNGTLDALHGYVDFLLDGVAPATKALMEQVQGKVDGVDMPKVVSA